MNDAELKSMVEQGNEKRGKMKALALELVRTAAEQGVSVREFLLALDTAKRMAMEGRLTPPDR